MINKIILFLNNSFLSNFFNSNKIVNPKRDWVTLTILFLIMAASAITFDIVIYKKISGGDMYVSVNRGELNLESLKTNDVKKLIDNFEARGVLIDSSKIKPLIDPSI